MRRRSSDGPLSPSVENEAAALATPNATARKESLSSTGSERPSFTPQPPTSTNPDAGLVGADAVELVRDTIERCLTKHLDGVADVAPNAAVAASHPESLPPRPAPATGFAACPGIFSDPAESRDAPLLPPHQRPNSASSASVAAAADDGSFCAPPATAAEDELPQQFEALWKDIPPASKARLKEDAARTADRLVLTLHYFEEFSSREEATSQSPQMSPLSLSNSERMYNVREWLSCVSPSTHSDPSVKEIVRRRLCRRFTHQQLDSMVQWLLEIAFDSSTHVAWVLPWQRRASTEGMPWCAVDEFVFFATIYLGGPRIHKADCLAPLVVLTKSRSLDVKRAFFMDAARLRVCLTASQLTILAKVVREASRTITEPTLPPIKCSTDASAPAAPLEYLYDLISASFGKACAHIPLMARIVGVAFPSMTMRSQWEVLKLLTHHIVLGGIDIALVTPNNAKQIEKSLRLSSRLETIADQLEEACTLDPIMQVAADSQPRVRSAASRPLSASASSLPSVASVTCARRASRIVHKRYLPGSFMVARRGAARVAELMTAEMQGQFVASLRVLANFSAHVGSSAMQVCHSVVRDAFPDAPLGYVHALRYAVLEASTGFLVSHPNPFVPFIEAFGRQPPNSDHDAVLTEVAELSFRGLPIESEVEPILREAHQALSDDRGVTLPQLYTVLDDAAKAALGKLCAPTQAEGLSICREALRELAFLLTLCAEREDITGHRAVSRYHVLRPLDLLLKLCQIARSAPFTAPHIAGSSHYILTLARSRTAPGHKEVPSCTTKGTAASPPRSSVLDDQREAVRREAAREAGVLGLTEVSNVLYTSALLQLEFEAMPRDRDGLVALATVEGILNASPVCCADETLYRRLMEVARADAASYRRRGKGYLVAGAPGCVEGESEGVGFPTFCSIMLTLARL